MTPAEVEEAAEAAVLRFHARGGVVPAPPAREEIPARVPRPVTPVAGRYCPPAICWCGSCAWFTPAPPVNYEAAVRKLAEEASGRRPSSSSRSRASSRKPARRPAGRRAA